MNGFKKIMVTILILLPAIPAHAAPLNAEQLQRVRAAKHMLAEVEAKPLNETVRELERSRYPEGHLKILEAVAQTYSEIIREYELESLERKQWLHGMIQLNLAYIQLAGPGEKDSDSSLTRLIKRKLLRRLPPELLSDPRLAEP